MARRLLLFVLFACLLPHAGFPAAQFTNGDRVLEGTFNACTSSGSTNTYACSLGPAFTTYQANSCYTFTADSANNGVAEPTINFSGAGAKTIKKRAGGVTTPLIANDIGVLQIVNVCYDGTNMQMQSTLGNAAAGGAVSSVFSRTGTVVAQTGDYTEAQISVSDITTNNATPSAHGFLKKLSNVSTEFMNGQGNWATPAGGGNVTATGSPTTGQLAVWTSATAVQGMNTPTVYAANYGVLCDGSTNDAPALQNAVNAAIVGTQGRAVSLPRGTGNCMMGSGLTIANVSGLIFEGNGAWLEWTGNTTTPLILCQDCRDTVFRNFNVLSQTNVLLNAMQFENGSGTAVTPTSNTVAHVVVECVAGKCQNGFRMAQGAGGDNNNDFNTFQHVSVNNVANACAKIEHSQSKHNAFVDFSCSNNNIGNYVIETNPSGSFHCARCGGGYSAIADFYLANPDDYSDINDGNFEGSKRLLLTGGPSGASFPIMIANTRWAANGLHPDHRAIVYQFPGPLVLVNLTIEPYTLNLPTEIYWSNTQGANGSFSVIGSYIASTLPEPFTGSLPSFRTGTHVAGASGVSTALSTLGTHAVDFGAAPSLKIPTSAGATTTTNGLLAYDTTTNMLHAAQSNADAKIPQFTITPSDTHCTTWVVSGSTYKLGSTGAPCGAGGGITSATNFGAMYATGASTATSTAALANGQMLIGSTSVAPVAGTIGGTTNKITATPGPGTLTLNTGSLVVHTDQANTWGAFAQDMGTATSFKMPVAANATTTVNGLLAYDATNHMLHAGQNSADAKIPQFTIAPVDNDCVKWVVAGSTYKLGTASAACGGAGGLTASGPPAAGQVALWTTSTNLSGSTFLPAANVPAFTGDVTTAGATLTTILATVNPTNTGTFTLGTFTVNAKGLITSASSGVAVTSLATTAPLTGGTITTTGTLGCATCVTSAAVLAANAFVLGSSGTQATQTLALTGVVVGNGASAPTAAASVTTDQVLRVTGSNTFAFGAINLASSAAVGVSVLANANTTAVSTNTINTIVLRDGSGNFSAGTITASLTGTASIAATGDSATGFFPAGQIEPARGGTGVDSSASTGVPRATSGVWTFDAGINHLAPSTSAQLATVLSDEVGSGSGGVVVFNQSPTLVTPILGTPTSVTLTNATGLPITTGVSGLGTNVAAFLATPSSANLLAAVTNETGTGLLVFATSPVLTTPQIADFTTATHTHQTTAQGGTLTDAALATAVTVPKGGTGLAVGVSGGIPYFSTTTAMSSSALLFQRGVMLGGGAGGAPTAVPSLGTTGQVFTSNGSGVDPSWQTAASSGVTTGGTTTNVAFYNASSTVDDSSGFTFDTTSVLTEKMHCTLVSNADVTLGAHRCVHMLTGNTNRTVNLPAAGSSVNARVYEVFKIDTGTGTVTLHPSTTDFVNGVNGDTTVTARYEGWKIIEENAVAGWIVGKNTALPVPIASGGTGQITKAAAFDALSPLTTAGDFLYGGTAGTGTRLAAGTGFLTGNGASAPTFTTAPTGALVGAGQANTWTTGAQDMSGATSLTVPISAGKTTATNGFIGYDSTNHMLHGAQNGADAKIPQFTVTPINNECATWVVSASNYKLASTACAGGGGLTASGPPTSGQLATWTTATNLTGVPTLPAANFPALTGAVTTTGASLATVPGTVVKSVNIDAGSMDVVGACTANASAALLTNGPKVPSITCTNTATDSIEFALKMPKNWNAGTIQIELDAFSLGNNNAEVFSMNFSGQCVRTGDSVLAHTITSGATALSGANVAATITWGSSTNREQSVTTGGLTLNGTCAAGARVYLHGLVSTIGAITNMTPMTDLKILGARVIYTITGVDS